MHLHRVQALRRGFFMWLVLPASSFAQARTPQPPTIFSASAQLGAVSIRAAVVLPDYTVKPLPHLTVVAKKGGATDSITGVTDLDGHLIMTVPVGSYTIRAVAQIPGGRAISWAVPVVVRQAATQRVELSDVTASPDVERPTSRAGGALPAGAAVTADSRGAVGSFETETPLVARPISSSEARPGTGVNSIAQSRTEESPSSSRSVRAKRSSRYRSNTRGPFVGVAVEGSALRSTDLGVKGDVGLGMSANAGWGLTRSLALFLSMSRASMTRLDMPYRVDHVDAGLRWHFVGVTRAVVPSLDVAFSRRTATRLYYGGALVSGASISAGAGVQYFVSRTAALGSTVRWMGGEFSRIGAGGGTVNGFELDAATARMDLGLTWYPR